MSLIVIPPNSGYPVNGFSLPDMISFCVDDDGTGGQINLNGLGIVSPTVTGAVDIKRMFTDVGLLFNSYPLLNAFRKLSPPTGGSPAALAQLVKQVEVNIVRQSLNGSTVYPDQPAVFPVAIGSPDAAIGVPFLAIVRELSNAGEGPGSPGIWRVALKLRHTTTN